MTDTLTAQTAHSTKYRAILNLSVVTYLLNAGFRIERIVPNYRVEGKFVFLFPFSAELDEVIHKYSSQKKKQTN